MFLVIFVITGGFFWPCSLLDTQQQHIFVEQHFKIDIELHGYMQSIHMFHTHTHHLLCCLFSDPHGQQKEVNWLFQLWELSLSVLSISTAAGEGADHRGTAPLVDQHLLRALRCLR